MLASILQWVYWIRSGRLLLEQFHHKLRFRFLGLISSKDFEVQGICLLQVPLRVP